MKTASVALRKLFMDGFHSLGLDLLAAQSKFLLDADIDLEHKIIQRKALRCLPLAQQPAPTLRRLLIGRRVPPGRRRQLSRRKKAS